MKKRRLISVMLAGMMTAGVGTMTGCSSEYDYEDNMGSRKFTDAYIVLESKDKKTVHKGDYELVFLDPEGHGYAGTGFVKLDLDCGKNYFTNADCYIYENTPSKDSYEVVCEDCFSLDESL